MLLVLLAFCAFLNNFHGEFSFCMSRPHLLSIINKKYHFTVISAHFIGCYQ